MPRLNLGQANRLANLRLALADQDPQIMQDLEALIAVCELATALPLDSNRRAVRDAGERAREVRRALEERIGPMTPADRVREAVRNGTITFPEQVAQAEQAIGRAVDREAVRQMREEPVDGEVVDAEAVPGIDGQRFAYVTFPGDPIQHQVVFADHGSEQVLTTPDGGELRMRWNRPSRRVGNSIRTPYPGAVREVPLDPQPFGWATGVDPRLSRGGFPVILDDRPRLSEGEMRRIRIEALHAASEVWAGREPGYRTGNVIDSARRFAEWIETGEPDWTGS